MWMTGSGGLGAVSAGVAEPIAWLLLGGGLVLVVFVGWKLVKVLMALMSGG